MSTINTMIPPEYTELTDRLDAVGGRFRLAAAMHALARFCLLVVPITVGFLFIAGYFSTPAWVNALLIAGIVITFIAGYVSFLHAPLFHRPSYAQIARLVEENSHSQPDAGIDNALINAVLLAEDLELASASGGTLRGSNAWIPHVLKEASRSTENVHLEKSVPWRQPRNAWLLALTVLIVCAAIIAVSPSTFAHGISVLMSPAKFVPHQGSVKILSVLPGSDTALAGQPLLFSVNVEAPEHKTIDTRLQVHFASGKTATFPMTPFGADNSQYVRQGLIAAEDMDYMILAGDTQSENYHITVLPQIHLTSFSIQATPPAYTHHDPLKLDLAGKEASASRGTLEVPAGSSVNLHIALDGPAKEVLIDSGTTTGPAAMTLDATGYAATFIAKETQHFTIRINDGANRTIRQFPESSSPTAPQEYYTLSVLPDAPPTIAVSQPGHDLDAKPGDKVALEAQAADDYGVTQIRLEIAKGGDKEFHAAKTWPVDPAKDGKPARGATVRYTLDLPATDYKLGDSLRYRFVSTDNRDLTPIDPALTPQSTTGQVFLISFNDKAATAAASGKLWEELRQKLLAILDKQVALHKSAAGFVTGMPVSDMRKVASPIGEGQKTIRSDLAAVAKDFPFDSSMKIVQKSLEVLSVEDAAQAVERTSDILLLSDSKSLPPLATKLKQNQSRIIDILQTLLAIIASEQDRLAKAVDNPGGDLPPDAKDAWKKLADDLKNFEKEQSAVIDATASLAKKPKDQFDANDQKKLNDLAAVEDKWEKFLNERIADMSKLAEQDQANGSLLEELVQMKVELATAKDALATKATEIATPLEENGLEEAKALESHLERWLQQQPDRQNWQMEEPVTQDDPKMAELPKQLQDMVGDLMDKEEDLTQDMESLASKYADSLDKGAGWDAMDGPISNMSAQGVTGNELPKDMEIQGRSGEGREGRSSGEMVGSTAEGKEGRQTPTRLTNDPFSTSQVDDKSQLPEGGATGGGKKGGLGSQGLEGPAPADDPNITQRLAGQQAELRNETERLALQMNASGFDNFKLVESNAYLKKSEDAIKQNQYHTALYYQEQAVQSLNTAKVIASGQVHVIADTSPTAGTKTQKDIDSAMNGPMPKGYADPVKAYFEKLAAESTGK